MTSVAPSYIALHTSGILKERVEKAYAILSSCTLCPHECQVDRLGGETGFCRSGILPKVASFGPHFGEEAPLVGRYGSGTIFLANCNMRCEFCQNFDISHLGYGKEVTCEHMAEMMLELQKRGCHNINFVTPTHFIPQIMNSTNIACEQGLRIPLVYNTGGYDRVESLMLLENVFDIYMPDAKYGRNDIAIALSHAPGYVEAMKGGLKEMHRQVGDLDLVNGLAVRGMIIRHLVLPENLASSELVMEFIGTELSRDSYVNIMDQYRPMGNVLNMSDRPLFKKLQRRITEDELQYAIRCAKENGLHRGFQDPW